MPVGRGSGVGVVLASHQRPTAAGDFLVKGDVGVGRIGAGVVGADAGVDGEIFVVGVLDV